MNRPTRSKAKLTLAIVAALATFSATSASLAAAASPAGDEYRLVIPGVHQSNNTVIGPESASSPGVSGRQEGVVGEGNPPDSALDSFLSVLGAAPAALLAGLVAILCLVLISIRIAPRPSTREAR